MRGHNESCSGGVDGHKGFCVKDGWGRVGVVGMRSASQETNIRHTKDKQYLNIILFRCRQHYS